MNEPQHEPAAPGPDVVRIPARVDAWLVAAAALAGAGLVALATPVAFAQGVPWPLRAAVVGMALGTAALLASVTIPVRYEADRHGIRIRSGRLRFVLAYRDLARADKVVGGLQGPCWSLVRVRLTLRSGERVEIAPRDRDAFLELLRARAGGERRDERSWRAGDDPAAAADGG